MRSESRSSYATLLYAALLLASGCSLYFKDAKTANRSLDYIAWASADACANNHNVSAGEIAIRPGMRVTFHSSSLLAHSKNAITPRLESYEWIVPRVCCTQPDYLLIGNLIAGAKRDGFDDDIGNLRQIGQGLPSDAFHSQIDAAVYEKVVSSLQWHPINRSPVSLCGTVAGLRQLVAEPTKDDFNAPLSAQNQLSFDLNDVHFEFGGGNAGYFNCDVERIDKPSPWYLDTPFGARVLVTVEVPVRLQSELFSRYVPVYTSFDELQRQLGVEITGFRRSAVFFNAIDVQGFGHSRARESVISDDGYFTVWFGRWRGWARSEKAQALVARVPRNELLVAPGDVVLIHPRSRLQPTDDPAVR